MSRPSRHKREIDCISQAQSRLARQDDIVLHGWNRYQRVKRDWLSYIGPLFQCDETKVRVTCPPPLTADMIDGR